MFYFRILVPKMDLTCVKSKNLMEAVQKNRQDEILTRLRLGEKVDAAYTMGRTALHCAAANRNLEAVSTLLIYSPSVKVCCRNNQKHFLRLLFRFVTQMGTQLCTWPAPGLGQLLCRS